MLAYGYVVGDGVNQMKTADIPVLNVNLEA